MSLREFRASAAALLVAVSLGGNAFSGLLVTGVFDGPLAGGEPKVVELYATANIPDLSVYGVGAANNGGGTDGVELVLSGAASAGDFLYIVDDNNEGQPVGVKFASYFGFTPALLFDTNSGSFGGPASINGDDAIEVFYDASGAFSGSEAVVDVFGDISVDGTGTPWDYMDGWAYRNNGTGPDGSTFVLGNWSFSGVNATDGETSNGTAANPFPIGTYRVPEPASLALVVWGLLLALPRRER